MCVFFKKSEWYFCQMNNFLIEKNTHGTWATAQTLEFIWKQHSNMQWLVCCCSFRFPGTDKRFSNRKEPSRPKILLKTCPGNSLLIIIEGIIEMCFEVSRCEIGWHWFRCWLDIVRQRAITSANIDPDPCHHTALGYNELSDSLNVLLPFQQTPRILSKFTDPLSSPAFYAS